MRHLALLTALLAGCSPDGEDTAADTGASTSGLEEQALGAEPAGEGAPAGPAGSVVIDGGAAWTTSTAVSLALEASSSGSTVTHMCISNTSSCTSWAAYKTSKSWTLASGSGSKTVSVWFKDATGAISTVSADTIGLDSTAPTNPAISSSQGSDGAAALEWEPAAESGSGLASYKVVYKSGTTAPASKCTNGTVASADAATTADVTGLTNGTTYTFRVCAVDVAGNVSTGVTAAVIPAPEFIAPAGTVSITGGAEWTAKTSVKLTLSASDASGVSKMCISNTDTCSAWTTYATSKSWTLASGSGSKTVSVWFKDIYGNVSEDAAFAEIGLDTTKPTNGTLTTSTPTEKIAVGWSGFSDAHSGISSYRFVYAKGATAPSSCSAGTLLYEGAALWRYHEGVENGATYSYRVCAVDAAGNVSTGTKVTVTAEW